MRIAGSLLSVQIANPAAGAEWTFTVPAGFVYELISVHWVLATSAVVLNRVSGVVVKDTGANVLGVWRGGVTQPASQTQNYSLGPFDGQSDPNGNFGAIVVPAPRNIRLPAGFQMISNSHGLDVGDQYSAIFAAFEVNPQ